MQLDRPPEGHPDECPNCWALVGYWDDPEGIWAECDCSAGYIT
jgi:hypothetical protein